jgi:hypothetical protein
MRLTILGIEKTKQDNQLEIRLLFDKQEKSYLLYFFDDGGILGCSMKDELIKILCRDLKKNKHFLNLIFSFYQGVSTDFPIDLGEF